MEVATTDIKVVEATPKESQNIVPNKNSTRFKKRFMKRQWEQTENGNENGESEQKKVCERPVERIKRKKMAVLLGYCGVDYYGMQRNPGVRTIEEDLLKALMEAKYLTEEDFNNQQNAQFQRSSRTDKGVSAARQVVSLKLPLEVNVGEINKRLPECIKVFTVKRVTNKFNSKSKCNARTYSYTLPTYVLEPSLLTDEERRQYRITEEKKEQMSKVLQVYKGTKSYHNFTEKKHFQDPSSLRFMMGFTIDRVFVESDMEFAVLLVKGQSFMLHQIRKMVGLAIAVVRGQTDSSILDRVFAKEKVMIPTAPGLGLVLDTVHYDRYDAKFKDSHDSLTWSDVEDEIHQFIHKHIYPVIVKGEVEGKSMEMWLEKLQRHSYEPSEELPEKVDEEELGGGDDDDDDEEIKEDSRKNLSPKIEVSYVESSEVKSNNVEDSNVGESKIEESALSESVKVDDSAKNKSAMVDNIEINKALEVNVGEINKRLPECIKVFTVKRVTNKFNSKSKCNARTYSYTLPTYVLEPSLLTDEERRQYRITEEKKEQMNKVLQVYKGTKSYHNFTEKKHFQDPSSLRFMMGFTIDRVFVESDMEFAVLLVKGQSFMLHQIRKMVGLAIAVVRGQTDSSILDRVFAKEKVMIPTAPGLGLVLDTVHYDRYDAKFKDSHDSLTWSDVEDEIHQFIHKHIYPVIVKGEVEGKSMEMWLEKLQRHSYEPSEEVPEKVDEEELGGGDDDDDDEEIKEDSRKNLSPKIEVSYVEPSEVKSDNVEDSNVGESKIEESAISESVKVDDSAKNKSAMVDNSEINKGNQ